jgi:hypothetical protein
MRGGTTGWRERRRIEAAIGGPGALAAPTSPPAALLGVNLLRDVNQLVEVDATIVRRPS